ncbi:glycosyltransferase [Nitrosovibrio sp. Nv6]|uniref:glycosyltransferase n=1 Tax=Nitrosovibrio sp. Nv6 TaxID=1855340 RepID=UPI0013149CEE|nr:glycosyltransferase [Nitrosovibrio sp. Nv6]
MAGRIRGMGIDFGHDEELIEGDAYNELGYHENKDLSYLGEEILIALGGDHMRPPFLESGWETSSLLDPFRAKAKLLVDTKFGTSPAWGWKDPRTSLLLPFWRQIFLPTHYIITIRNPLAVAESLLRRNGIAIRHGSELWFLHVASAIANTRGFKRKFVFFENASQSPLQLDRELAEFLSIDDSTASSSGAAPEFADTLVHHKQTDEQVYANTDIHSLAKALYRTLRELQRLEDRSTPDFLCIDNDEPSYQITSIAHIVETEPSLLINPQVLPNCLTSETKIAEYSKAELNKIIAEHSQQIANLEQTLTERSNHIHELSSVNSQLRAESAALFARLENILQSNSWKLTRPLRGLSRAARHGVSLPSSKQLLYQLVRIAGRKLPIPLKVKASCRNALLEFVYSGQSSSRPGIQAPTPEALGQLDPTMKPACCGLKVGLVSVVLPVYNQANLLGESIESVLAQTYKQFELIVINDGSTDDVEAVLERYADNLKVRIYSQPNQKLPKALTNGFAYAQGEFWTWTSADNLMEPTMLELLVEKLQSEPTVDMVYADYLAIDDRGELLQDPTWRAHNRPFPTTGEIRLPRSVRTLNTVQDNFIGPCFMYRGWIGRCLGEYDPQLGVEDYDYWMRINAFFKIDHLGKEKCLYRYRVHDNTLSANAHGHRIFEKVSALIGYEKERAKLYKTPIAYAVDDVGFKWLTLFGVDHHSISNIEDVDNQSTPKSTLIIIGINTLEKYFVVSHRAENYLVVIFDDMAADYVKLKRLCPESTMVLAGDEKIAARVRLVTDLPIFDATSARAHTAVVAFYKNKCLLNTTRKAEERHRLPSKEQFSSNARHRVLLQVDNFTQGGMENVVIDLAVSLKKLGTEVSIAILGKEGNAAAVAREQDLDVTSFGCPPAKEAYEAYLKKRNIGLVNAHFSVFGAEVCVALNIPFLQTIHNSYVWFDPDVTAKYKYSDVYTSAYICVSATAARYADIVLGLDVSKMKIIPNGTDPDSIEHTKFKLNRKNLRNRWHIDSGSPVFLNVASIMATKAQLALVSAFSEVLKTKPSARLVLLGSVMESSYQDEIEKQIAALDIQDRVILAGYDRSVAKYYHAADVFVLPSYWEGWSLSLGEAMVNGLPCVITEVGSSYEFYGYERVEIIKPPFGDITRLNYLNLGNYVYGRNIEFEKQLADSMVRAADKPRLEIDEHLRQKLDREIAYKDYASFFSQIRALEKAGKFTH